MVLAGSISGHMFRLEKSALRRETRSVAAVGLGVRVRPKLTAQQRGTLMLNRALISIEL